MGKKIERLVALLFAGLEQTDIGEIDHETIEDLADNSQRAYLDQQLARRFVARVCEHAFLSEHDFLQQRFPAGPVFQADRLHDVD